MTYQRNMDSPLQNGVDQGLPQRIQQAEVAARDDDEAEDDRGRLPDLPAVGPLDATQLVDGVAEEGDDPAAAPVRMPGLGPLAVAAADDVALDGVVGALVVLVVPVQLVLEDAWGAVVVGVADLGRDGALLGEARLVDVGGGVVERIGGRRSLAQGRAAGTAAGAALGTAPLRTLTIAGHPDPRLARLAVRGVLPAPLAVLAQPDAIRVVALGLVGLVVPALALLAREGDSDPDVSAGHACGSPSEGKVEENGAGQRKTPHPARGRQERIASPPCPRLPRSRACATHITPCRRASRSTSPRRAIPRRRRCSPCTGGRSTGGCGATSSRRCRRPIASCARICAGWAGAGSRTTATSPRRGSRTTCSRCSTRSGSSGRASSGTTGAAGPAGCSRCGRPSGSSASWR